MFSQSVFKSAATPRLGLDDDVHFPPLPESLLSWFFVLIWPLWWRGGASFSSSTPQLTFSPCTWSTFLAVDDDCRTLGVCVGEDDVCGFSTSRPRGQWATASLAFFLLCCSTKWNSFAILGRAHTLTLSLAGLLQKNRKVTPE